MSLTRRELLQRLLTAGVGLTLSEVGFLLRGDRYAQALAQPARRKLALLIGINQYPESVADRSPVRGAVLTGCLTDIELQRELLTARFGFLPADILTLTDQQATRSAIVDAFQFHLAQAQANDTVIVHFSGLGSRVKLEDGTLRSSIVPIDATLPTEENPDCMDLFTDTLELLLGGLESDRVIAVLDCGFSSLGTSMQGNLRIRARPNAPVGQISEAELALRKTLQRQRPTILSAAAIDQPAVEYQWNGFSAGLFTYALTQQLWQTTQTKLTVAFEQAKAIAQRFSTQQPQLNTKTIPPLEIMAASGDGAILGNEADDRFRVWLGGLPPQVVENYAAGSLLSVEGRQAIVRSRDGLIAIARWMEPDAAAPEIGQIVQEVVRILPPDISLTIALDSSLERIERVDATSAFAALPRIAVATGDHADYLFGKLQAPTLTASVSPEVEPAPLKGYGLFQTDRSAIANTLIEADEAVKTAVTRLAPQLQTLLALKLLRLMENRASSQLNVEARLLMSDRVPQIVRPQRVSDMPPAVLPALPLNSRIDYQLHNRSDRSVYAILIGLDSDENVTAYLPPAVEAGEIAPDAVLTIASDDWLRQIASGWVETHVIFSTSPFGQAESIAAGAVRPVAKPLDLVQAVLQDLHQASGSESSAIALDVNHWATFSFAYQLEDSTS
ncbi:caspase family protein [Microcoleus sp. FACHB-1515]|uniref:caspase family protein n=1 Tax=Cyanophyceae TaxID=3028117 RepID=UPI0016878577|nr:caspase family protein [Microcoleus sp. FACHB-1515]MBD2089428.1 caspase family protein [Microcoleus sp. FACHB-1515]